MLSFGEVRRPASPALRPAGSRGTVRPQTPPAHAPQAARRSPASTAAAPPAAAPPAHRAPLFAHRRCPLQILAQPATHALTLMLVCIWLAMRQKCLGYAALGKSYEAVVWQGQWWRCATAVLAHVEWWHLLSNAHALLGYGWIEEQRGTSFFIHTTILIALLAAPVSASAVGCCRLLNRLAQLALSHGPLPPSTRRLLPLPRSR